MPMTEPAFRALDLGEMHELYLRDMPRQFPESEIKPWSVIRALVQKGRYAGWALEREGTILCYALCARAGRNVLLDYLATPDPWKNHGYGSQALLRLRSVSSEAERILIEAEDPDVLSGDEATMARRRLGFYARNGFAETSVGVRLYGVEFRILSSENGPERDANARSGLESVYWEIIPAPIRPLVVRFHD